MSSRRRRLMAMGGRGGIPLLRDGALSPLATFARAQTSGVEATAEALHVPVALLGGGALSWPATFTRAQTAGVEATAEAFPVELPAAPAIISAGYVDPRLALTRTQADGAVSTDTLFRTYGANVPRFAASGRLLLEGARPNAFENPRLLGAVVGSPGTIWTGGQIFNTGGVAWSIAGAGEEFGASYVDLRLSGTTTGAIIANLGARFNNNTTITATSGQLWAVRHYFRLVAGAVSPGITFGAGVIEFNGGTFVALQETAFVPASLVQPVSRAFTANAATTNLRAHINGYATGAGIAVDLTLRCYGRSMVEQAASSSTPILPAPDTIGASTRGPDLLPATLASLGVGAAGAAYGVSMLPQSAPASADQMLWQTDDATDNNRYRIRNLAGGNTIVAGRVTGGSSADMTSLGSMTPGTPFAWGIAWDRTTGEAIAAIGGGPVRYVSGGPTSVTTARWGSNAAGTANLFGEQGFSTVIPGRPSMTEFQARIAALPLT